MNRIQKISYEADFKTGKEHKYEMYEMRHSGRKRIYDKCN